MLLGLSLSCAREPGSNPAKDPPPFGELTRAVANNQRSKVASLLDAGATIDENIDSDSEHISPLMVALLRGHYELARFLLERGASPYVSYAGYNAKDFAYQVLPEDHPLVRFLENSGAFYAP